MKKFLQSITIRKILFQSAALIGISCIIGVLTVDRAKLTSDLERIAASLKPIATMDSGKLREMLGEGKVICIDARSASDFTKGHIKDAISLPFTEIDQALAQNLDLFTEQKPIVVYCGGEGCDLSNLLARRLLSIGMDQVSVFTAGWKAWKAAGLPIEP